MKTTIKRTLLLGAMLAQSLNIYANGDTCPTIYKKAEFKLPFNPAFTAVDRFTMV